MKKSILSLSLLLILQFAAASQDPDVILGIWHSPNGTTDIEILKKGEMYYGVTTLLDSSHDAHEPSGLDTGTVVLKDFKYRGNGIYHRGKVVDLRSGKTHNGQIRIVDHDKINVRIFFGIIQFGRTETWLRVKQ